MERLLPPILTTTLALACAQAWAADDFDLDIAEYRRIPQKQTQGQEQEKQVKFKPKLPVRVEIDHPEVKKMIEKYLPLITQQQEEELDSEQVGFLAEEAPDNVKTVLRTKGYFNSKVNICTEKGDYVVSVTPGPCTRVDNVNVAILGDILSDENLTDYYKHATENWGQPAGGYFDNAEWSSSKTLALSAVTRKKYPLAKISTSQATVNPGRHTAGLSIVVENKQPVYFGDLEISGTKRHPISVVQGLARFRPGSSYDLDLLPGFQQALEQNGHYSGVSAQADFNNMKDDRIPVKTNVSETKLHKLETGVRYGSEYGLGGKTGYDYYNLLNRGYIGSVVWDMDKYEIILAAGISQPRNSDSKYWTTNMSYSYSTTQNLEKRTLTIGTWCMCDRNGIGSHLDLEFITEDHKVPDTDYDLGRSHTTILTASWKRQNIETESCPENGYYLDGKTGAMLGSLFSSTAMARVAAKAGYFFTPENRKIGTFIARGQAGYVYAKGDKEAPFSLELRTGGAPSVRGYELDSVGKAGPNSSVLFERALLVGSLECQFPLTKSLSGTVSHDTGDAAVNFKKTTMKHSTGLGVCRFSSVAPSAFDIAYGYQDKKIRWHTNLGTHL